MCIISNDPTCAYSKRKLRRVSSGDTLRRTMSQALKIEILCTDYRREGTLAALTTTSGTRNRSDTNRIAEGPFISEGSSAKPRCPGPKSDVPRAARRQAQADPTDAYQETTPLQRLPHRILGND